MPLDRSSLPDIDLSWREIAAYVIVGVLLVSAGMWLAPVVGVHVLPHSQFLSIQSVEVTPNLSAENATAAGATVPNATNVTVHDVRVDYEATDRLPVQAVIRLKHDEGTTAPDPVLQRWEFEGVVSPHDETAAFPLAFETPEAGLYYYEFEVTYHPGYGAERTFTHQTDPFLITSD